MTDNQTIGLHVRCVNTLTTQKTMIKFGLLATLEAKPGKEAEVEAFLKSALPLAQNEPDTVTWYVFKLNASTFGIFDTFEGEAGRQAHLSGPIAQA